MSLYKYLAMIVELAGETGCVKWNLCCNSKIEHCYIEQSVAHMLEQFQGEQHHDIKERFQFEDCVRMSLMKIAEEREDCDPMEGLEGRGEGSTRRRGEEAEGRKEGNEEKDEKEDEEKDEDELEDWKREGREARVCYPGMRVNQLAGEEMMEGMERVRKNRPGRGMSIMNEVSLVEQRKEDKSCCVCQ